MTENFTLPLGGVISAVIKPAIMLNRPVTRIAVAVILVSIVFVVFIYSRLTAKDPLDPSNSSTELAVMPVVNPIVKLSTYNYTWIDPHTILVCVDGGKSVYVDELTGVQRPCLSLNSALANPNFDPRSVQGVVWIISPNKKYALTEIGLSRSADPRAGEWLIASLDGRHTAQYPMASYEINYAWGADSHSWYSVSDISSPSGRPELAEYRLHECRVVSRTKIPFSSDEISPDEDIQPLPSGDIVDSARTNGENDEYSGISVYGLVKGKEQVVDSYNDLFADSVVRNECVVSPDGKRVAWQCNTDMSILQEMTAVLTKGAIEGRDVIYESNLDGSNLKRLVVGPREDIMNGPFSLQWTPDGKHVSYVYEDHLWIAPA